MLKATGESVLLVIKALILFIIGVLYITTEKMSPYDTIVRMELIPAKDLILLQLKIGERTGHTPFRMVPSIQNDHPLS